MHRHGFFTVEQQQIYSSDSTCWLLSILPPLKFCSLTCEINVKMFISCASLLLSRTKKKKKGSVISFIDFPLRSLSLLIEPTFPSFPSPNFQLLKNLSLMFATCGFWLNERRQTDASEQRKAKPKSENFKVQDESWDLSFSFNSS